MQIACISTPYISVRYYNIPQLRLRRKITLCASKKYHLRKAQISLQRSCNITDNKKHSIECSFIIY